MLTSFKFAYCFVLCRHTIFFQYFIDQFRRMIIIRNRSLARATLSPIPSYSNRVTSFSCQHLPTKHEIYKSILYDTLSLLCKSNHVDGPEPEESWVAVWPEPCYGCGMVCLSNLIVTPGGYCNLDLSLCLNMLCVNNS